MAFRHLEVSMKFLFVVSLSCLRFEALVYEVVAIHYRFQERQDVSRVCLDECIRARAHELQECKQHKRGKASTLLLHQARLA